MTLRLVRSTEPVISEIPSSGAQLLLTGGEPTPNTSGADSQRGLANTSGTHLPRIPARVSDGATAHPSAVASPSSPTLVDARTCVGDGEPVRSVLSPTSGGTGGLAASLTSGEDRTGVAAMGGAAPKRPLPLIELTAAEARTLLLASTHVAVLFGQGADESNAARARAKLRFALEVSGESHDLGGLFGDEGSVA